MFAAWRVAVVLSARNLTSPAFASFIADAKAAESSQERMKRAIQGVHTAATIAFAGAGVALSAFVVHGLAEAGQFELAMKNVAISTGAAGSQLRALQGMAIDLSGKTSQDVTQIAKEMAMAGKAGLTANQLQSMMPQIAAYADVQMRSHNVDPIEAVKEAVQEAHLFQAYGYKQQQFHGKQTTDLQAMLEYMNELSFVQPEGMQKVVTQSAYFVPIARALGATMDQSMDLLGLMGQTGFLRGKGGTGLAQVVNSAINTTELTASRSAKKTEALRGLGIINADGSPAYVDRQGHIQLQAMLDHLAKVAENTNPAHYQQMLNAAMTANGARMTAVMTSPAAQEQLIRLRAKMHNIPKIQEAQNEYLGQFSVSLNTLRTNVNTAIAALFLPLAQRLTPVIRELAARVMDFAKWVYAHPGLGLDITLVIIGAAAASFAVAGGLALRQLWLLNGALLTLAGSARAAAAAEDLQAGSNLLSGASGGGKLGKFFKWILGGEIIAPFAKSVWTTFTDLASKLRIGLLGDVRRIPGSNIGRVIADKGWMGGSKITSFMMDLGERLGPLALRFAALVPWVARLAIVIGEVGSKFIPIVGWVLLVAQAMQFFHQNPAAIGWWVGQIQGWITFKLMPGIWNAVVFGSGKIWGAFTALMMGIWNVVSGFAKSTVGGVMALLHGDFAGAAAQFAQPGQGLANGAVYAWKGMMDDFSKFNNSFEAGMTQQQLSAMGVNLSGFNGVTPGAKFAASYSASKATANQVSPSVNNTLNGGINITIKDSPNAKNTARAVVNEINQRIPFASKAAGGGSNTPWMPTIPRPL